MELRRSAVAIQRRIYLLVVGAVLMSAFMYLWAARRPVYQVATAQIVVTFDAGSLITADRIAYASTLAQHYAALPISAADLQLMQDEVPSRSVAQIAAALDVTPLYNQPIIQVSATDTDAETAVTLANVAARAIVRADAQLAASERAGQLQQIASLRTQLQQTNTQIADTQAAIATATANHQDTSADLKTLTQLQSEQSSLNSQLTTAKTAAGPPQADFWVSQLATSATADGLSPAVNAALGGLAGLLVGFGSALLLDLLDGVVRTGGDTARFAGLPTLEVLHDPLDGAADEVSAVQPEDYLPVAGEYERLLRSLEFLNAVQRLQVLLVASADGSSFSELVGLKLAITYARSGKNTLVVDANWDAPSLDARFGIPDGQRGFFTNILAMTADETRAQEGVYPTEIPNLSVVPVGPLPPNVDDLLRMPYYDQWLTKIRAIYANIVILPPLQLGSIASSQLVEVTDGVLVVARAGATRGSELAEVVRFLRRANTYLMGAAIVNGAKKPVAMKPDTTKPGVRKPNTKRPGAKTADQTSPSSAQAPAFASPPVQRAPASPAALRHPLSGGQPLYDPSRAPDASGASTSSGASRVPGMSGMPGISMPSPQDGRAASRVLPEPRVPASGDTPHNSGPELLSDAKSVRHSARNAPRQNRQRSIENPEPRR